ncbi:hypothetical protein EZV62_015756 [Acer yangbiense]|uniref:Pentatricopeptide repeat-containing protein n=1 Tax=Acer yangbiense TaxID=1000413 RepID=A0A5C7HLN1_9ROSI|nr:hypothetical protein EZV62_015756 [Acer yangbiense]
MYKRMMQKEGIEDDEIVMVGLVQACANLGHLKLGLSLHGCMIKRNLDRDVIVQTSLVDMHAKNGHMVLASHVFKDISCKNVVSWVHSFLALIKTVWRREFDQVLGTTVIDMYSKCRVLSSLSHLGLMEEGQYWFDLMVSEYKIQPSEKYYAYMVDLLARGGQVEEALELINSMKTEAVLAVWVALLSGCYNHKKLLIGEVAAKKVLELNPDELGIQALVSNFFAMKENWDELAGRYCITFSLVEVNGDLHAFLMEDKSHHQHENLKSMLDNLYQDMRGMRGLVRVMMETKQPSSSPQ